jgi:hypothetical protein
MAGAPYSTWLEAGNEPLTHSDKIIHVEQLRAVLATSGFHYTSGVYEDNTKFWGTYGVWHSKRVPYFSRYCHDAMEYFQGHGPHNTQEPACPVPWIDDEPGKPQDIGDDVAAWLGLYGGCSMFAAGATFHCETGKYAEPRTAIEEKLYRASLDALDTFPADVPGGGYRRIVETGQPHDARTYVIGDTMVRCQQNGVQAPEAGWARCDAFGVLWKKS